MGKCTILYFKCLHNKQQNTFNKHPQTNQNQIRYIKKTSMLRIKQQQYLEQSATLPFFPTPICELFLELKQSDYHHLSKQSPIYICAYVHIYIHIYVHTHIYMCVLYKDYASIKVVICIYIYMCVLYKDYASIIVVI